MELVVCDEVGKEPDAQEMICITLDDLIVGDDNGHSSLPDTLKVNMGDFGISLALSCPLMGWRP